MIAAPFFEGAGTDAGSIQSFVVERGACLAAALLTEWASRRFRGAR